MKGVKNWMWGINHHIPVINKDLRILLMNQQVDKTKSLDFRKKSKLSQVSVLIELSIKVHFSSLLSLSKRFLTTVQKSFQN
jgi:hypothetical protein